DKNLAAGQGAWQGDEGFAHAPRPGPDCSKGFDDLRHGDRSIGAELRLEDQVENAGVPSGRIIAYRRPECRHQLRKLVMMPADDDEFLREGVRIQKLRGKLR